MSYYQSLKNRRYFFLWGMLFLLASNIYGQNSIVGDGFGGRLWYKPCNVSAAPYGAFTTCNGELFGWGVYEKTTSLISLNNNQRYFAPTPVHNLKNIRYHSAGYTMTVINDNDSGFIWESSYNSRPVGILDSVLFCDGGWTLGAYIQKNGKAYISSIAQNPRLLNAFEYNQRKIVSDSLIYPGSPSNPNAITRFIIQDVKGIDNAVRCAVGVHAAYFLTRSGEVFVIAKDEGSSIGLGSNMTSLKATQINSLKDIIDIKTTTWGTLALDKNGNVFIWHRFSGTPTKEPLLSNIVAISGQCDGWVGLALKANGDAYVLNFPNQGTVNPITSKIAVTNVRDIIAGETFYYLYFGNDSFSYHSLFNRELVTTLGTLRIGTDFKLSKPCITNQKAQVFSICKGDSIQLHDSVFTKDGFYDVWHQDTVISIRLFVKDTFSTRSYYEYCQSDSFPRSRIDTFSYKQEDGTCVTHLNIIKVNPTFAKSDTFITCNQPITDYAGNVIYSDTQYTHRYSTGKGCDSIYHTFVKIHRQTETQFTSSKCIGDDFTYLNKSYTQSGFYQDTLKNFLGCDSVIYKITLYDTACGLTVFIPNVFSPNNKGPEINNTFQPYIENHLEFKMIILNRWGEKLYETSNINKGWNGTFLNEPCQDGVYVYHITVTSKTNKSYSYSGTVSLFR